MAWNREAMNLQKASFYMQLSCMALLLIACLQLSLSTAPALATLLEGRVEHQVGELSAQVQRVTQNTFPRAYQGTWHCVTTVTDSAVSMVIPGTVTQCNVEFKRDTEGLVQANWSQPGWTESQRTVVAFSATEAQMDRTAYYWADGAGGAWATRSRDSFTLTAANSLVSNSNVDQYVDGQYAGRYRTSSVFTKTDGQSTAMVPNQ